MLTAYAFLASALVVPRKHRVESSEGLYHVINRGNYRASIFESEGARASFKKALFEACGKFGWELSAYCVMSNHYHLCVATPKGNLSDGMRWLQATFAMRFNRYRRENGHLFQGRFKSLVVEPGDRWRALVDYIHLNPVRAGLTEAAGLRRYPWTSLFEFGKRKDRPGFFDCSWMDYDELLSDSPGGWTRYVNSLALRDEEDPKELERLERALCRGWCIGSGDFKVAMVRDLMSRPVAVRLEKDQLEEMNQAQWELMLQGCLKTLGKSESDAARDKRGAAWKKAIATRLREASSVKSSWLGERLNMGQGRQVNALCAYYERTSRRDCCYAKLLDNFGV